MKEPTVEALIDALRCLPGVGIKSAQRMAFHLLQHQRAGALRLAHSLQSALTHLRHCERCHTFTTQPICHTCLDPSRDSRLLCVVETPADQAALERTGNYNGHYFVLMGRLSPLDGVGVHDIGLQHLLNSVAQNQIQELIIATNFTAEGEATAHVIAQAMKSHSIHITRLARGVPIGSELEYVDLGTIAHALTERR